jgi:hypothetical protein
MNYLFRVSNLIGFVIMLSVMTGCMFSGGKVIETPLAKSTAEDQAKPTLSYKHLSFLGANSNFGAIPNFGANSKQVLLDELNKSRYFKEITEESMLLLKSGALEIETDIELYIELKDTYLLEGASFLAYLDAVHMLGSALTLTSIPYWSTTNYEVIAWVKNKKRLEKKYSK